MHLTRLSRAVASKRRNLGLSLLLLLSCSLTASAQCTSADREDTATRAGAEIFHVGTAEVRTAPDRVIDSAAYRCLQPDVYWHDQDWKLDLLLPAAENDTYSLRIRSTTGQEKIVKLDDEYFQIASISRAPHDQAIIVAYVYGNWSGEFSVADIVDLNSGKKIDEVVATSFSISPNRRFLIYENGSDPGYPFYDYRLYDVLRTPRENTCAFELADRQHEHFDEERRGFPLYPKKAGQITCREADLKPFKNEGHSPLSDFLWSADSSKVIFADAKNGKVLNVIMVTMPDGPTQQPHTSIDTPHLTRPQWSNPPREGAHTIHLSWKGQADETISLEADDPNSVIIQLSDFTRLP